MCSFLHQTSNALTHTPSCRRKNADLQTNYLERGCPSMIETCNNQKVSRTASSTLERYDPGKYPVSANFCRCFSADFAGLLGFTKHGGPCLLTSSPHGFTLPIVKAQQKFWSQRLVTETLLQYIHKQKFHFREGIIIIIIQTFQAPGTWQHILLRTPASNTWLLWWQQQKGRRHHLINNDSIKNRYDIVWHGMTGEKVWAFSPILWNWKPSASHVSSR